MSNGTGCEHETTTQIRKTLEAYRRMRDAEPYGTDRRDDLDYAISCMTQELNSRQAARDYAATNPEYMAALRLVDSLDGTDILDTDAQRNEWTENRQ